MEFLYARCAGLDVQKKTVRVCLLVRQEQGKNHKEYRTSMTTTQNVLNLLDWLLEQGCTHVAIEGTGVYTPPPMLQMGGDSVRSGRRRDRTHTEDHADVLFINLKKLHPDHALLGQWATQVKQLYERAKAVPAPDPQGSPAKQPSSRNCGTSVRLLS